MFLRNFLKIFERFLKNFREFGLVNIGLLNLDNSIFEDNSPYSHENFNILHLNPWKFCGNYVEYFVGNDLHNWSMNLLFHLVGLNLTWAFIRIMKVSLRPRTGGGP